MVFVPELAQGLLEWYERNSAVQQRIPQNMQIPAETQFFSAPSKDIIHELDQVLAQHYGFTDEELDFIINYDIKYRMGRESEGDEE